ncbi:hypothetical protein FA95DRAFT_1306761 [Auriscalpium vulgare]|uniref:Uncharacterized protein n=1 Tax=Auriscalpium vulgare TaxID=40419 RepID=A0ACB8R208_9AGAM|nr:hypothetical protein FA95DRAFT_1306761 [Auriscalpium vulgare]
MRRRCDVVGQGDPAAPGSCIKRACVGEKVRDVVGWMATLARQVRHGWGSV